MLVIWLEAKLRPTQSVTVQLGSAFDVLIVGHNKLPLPDVGTISSKQGQQGLLLPKLSASVCLIARSYRTA
jgi:hypothetical protein